MSNNAAITNDFIAAWSAMDLDAIMGVFEFRDGKICAWRDYFDMAAFTGE